MTDRARELLDSVLASYESRMKFCDIEPLPYYRDFVRHLRGIREALSRPTPTPQDDVERVAIRLARHLILGLLDRKGGGEIVERLTRQDFDGLALAALASIQQSPDARVIDETREADAVIADNVVLDIEYEAKDAGREHLSPQEEAERRIAKQIAAAIRAQKGEG